MVATLLMLHAMQLFICLVSARAMPAVVGNLSTDSTSPSTLNFNPGQCTLAPPAANDWKDLQIVPGPLPPPPSQENLQFSISDLAGNDVGVNQNCAEIRNFKFRNVRGIIRTKPYTLEKPDNVYWFSASADVRMKITSWRSLPEEGPGWNKRTMTGLRGDYSVAFEIGGRQQQVMFDVSLQPTAGGGGANGEMSLFWTSVPAQPGSTGNALNDTVFID